MFPLQPESVELVPSLQSSQEICQETGGKDGIIPHHVEKYLWTVLLLDMVDNSVQLL
jgi:hypothetical protein